MYSLECVNKIVDKESSVLEDRLVALEFLQEMAENIDHAIGIHLILEYILIFQGIENLGLWPSIIECLNDESAEIRTLAMWTCASAAQHNPKVQEALLRQEIIPKAFELLQLHTEVLAVKQKCVLLISAMVQQNPKAFIEFNRHKGFQIMGGLMESGEESLKKRSAFFMEHLFEERPRLKLDYSDYHELSININNLQ